MGIAFAWFVLILTAVAFCYLFHELLKGYAETLRRQEQRKPPEQIDFGGLSKREMNRRIRQMEKNLRNMPVRVK